LCRRAFSYQAGKFRAQGFEMGQIKVRRAANFQLASSLARQIEKVQQRPRVNTDH